RPANDDNHRSGILRPTCHYSKTKAYQKSFLLCFEHPVYSVGIQDQGVFRANCLCAGSLAGIGGVARPISTWGIPAASYKATKASGDSRGPIAACYSLGRVFRPATWAMD